MENKLTGSHGNLSLLLGWDVDWCAVGGGVMLLHSHEIFCVILLLLANLIQNFSVGQQSSPNFFFWPPKDQPCQKMGGVSVGGSPITEKYLQIPNGFSTEWKRKRPQYPQLPNELQGDHDGCVFFLWKLFFPILRCPRLKKNFSLPNKPSPTKLSPVKNFPQRCTTF